MRTEDAIVRLRRWYFDTFSVSHDPSSVVPGVIDAGCVDVCSDPFEFARFLHDPEMHEVREALRLRVPLFVPSEARLSMHVVHALATVVVPLSERDPLVAMCVRLHGVAELPHIDTEPPPDELVEDLRVAATTDDAWATVLCPVCREEIVVVPPHPADVPSVARVVGCHVCGFLFSSTHPLSELCIFASD